MRIQSIFSAVFLSASLLLTTGCGGRKTNGADAGGLNASVKIGPADATVIVGKTCSFIAQGATGGEYSWSVVPASLGTFTADGTFTASSAGVGIVVATSRRDSRYVGTTRVTIRPAFFTLSGSLGIAGADATLTYTNGTDQIATADASGNFSFSVPNGWTGVVTPSKVGFTFSPVSWSVENVQADPPPQAFTATPITLTISGNAGVAGATLAYVDGNPKLVTADGSGAYRFTVSYNWSGVVTPSKAGYAPNLQGYSFQPGIRAYSNVTADQAAQDYLATAIHHFGVVAFNNGWIGVLDPATQTVATPHLTGQLGSSGGGLFDVAITPNGLTTLVTNFGDKMVSFIDTSNPAAPTLVGGVTLSFFAEDIELTPDGRFALVTNGGFASRIAVIDVANRTLVEEFGPVTGDPAPWTFGYYNAIAVAADGQTVLAADYFDAKVHTLTLDDAGHLTYVGAIEMPKQAIEPPVPAIRPINIAISPDGKTAIVATTLGSQTPDRKPLFADMAFPVLSITAPGQVKLASYAKPTLNIMGAQSIAFDPAGAKAYVSCVREMPDPAPDPADPAFPRNVIVVLDIASPGVASHAGTTLETDFIGTSQLFGVDTLAMEPSGRYLYVSNMTLSGGRQHLQVLDVHTGLTVKMLPFGEVLFPEITNPDGTVTPASMEMAIPTGLHFRKP